MTTLAQAVAQLQRDVEEIEGDLRSRYPHVDPTLMCDSHGRYILLDARVALVNGLAALRRSEEP